MAFAATDSTTEPRKFSIGPLDMQILTWSAISGDVSGTITADRLSSISHIIIDGGLVMNAAPTYATNVATLSFNDPVASVYGTILAFGK